MSNFTRQARHRRDVKRRDDILIDQLVMIPGGCKLAVLAPRSRGDQQAIDICLGCVLEDCINAPAD